MSKTLLEQAIAEAKAVRQTALENAKLALEESITPKLQHMFSTKLSEEMEEEDETVNESEDYNLDEILNEEDETDENESEETDETEEETESDNSEETETEEVEDVDSKDVKDLSVEELKNVIRDIVQTELAGEVTPGDETMGDMPGDDSLEGETGLEGADVAPTTGDEMSAGMGDVTDDEDDIDLDEVLAELEAATRAGDNIKESVKKNVIKRTTNSKTGAPGFKKVGNLKEVETEDESEKLQEAYRTVNTLRKELKEINLLNAKLIYVNSIFKGKNLNEAQKIKIIEKFDKATNIKEAKLVFESLMESLKTPKSVGKKPLIKESLGFASKPAGNAPSKKVIVDSNVQRWQELAGIRKKEF